LEEAEDGLVHGEGEGETGRKKGGKKKNEGN